MATVQSLTFRILQSEVQKMAAQSPLDAVDQILNVLGFFGGFPLDQDTAPHDLPAFSWKLSVCQTIWSVILNIFYFAFPLCLFFGIVYQGLILKSFFKYLRSLQITVFPKFMMTVSITQAYYTEYVLVECVV